VPLALELNPTTNDPMASFDQRHDQMRALARVLMGLGHQTQLVSQARAVEHSIYDWKSPPAIQRRWYAVAPGYNQAQIELLRESLAGIGLTCSDPFMAPDVVRYKTLSRTVAQDERGEWCSTLVVRRWPREAAPGWLGQALGADEVVDIGVHISPQEPQRFARYLRKQAAWQNDANESKPDAANDLGARDAESVRRNLIAGTDRPAKVAVALTVRAKERSECVERTRAVSYRLGLSLADVREAQFEQDTGLQATGLTGKMGLLGAWRTLDCTSVASTGIFQPTTVNHKGGAPIGTSNGMLVRLDPFDPSLRSFSGLVTGSVGSGKSFLLKLLMLGLQGVETHVVEQSDSEYDGIPGVTLHRIQGNTESEQAAWLKEFVTNFWDTARRNPRPRLLVLDELWSLIRRPELAEFIEEMARRGRKFYLALWIATQQAEELLRDAKAVYDNAPIRIFLQQEDRDLGGLAVATKLSQPARQFLRGAGRGQALIYVSGMWVPVNVQATPEEYRLINTDPRERLAA